MLSLLQRPARAGVWRIPDPLVLCAVRQNKCQPVWLVHNDAVDPLKEDRIIELRNIQHIADKTFQVVFPKSRRVAVAAAGVAEVTDLSTA